MSAAAGVLEGSDHRDGGVLQRAVEVDCGIDGRVIQECGKVGSDRPFPFRASSIRIVGDGRVQWTRPCNAAVLHQLRPVYAVRLMNSRAVPSGSRK